VTSCIVHAPMSAQRTWMGRRLIVLQGVSEALGSDQAAGAHGAHGGKLRALHALLRDPPLLGVRVVVECSLEEPESGQGRSGSQSAACPPDWSCGTPSG
jgi:hypothetical protein